MKFGSTAARLGSALLNELLVAVFGGKDRFVNKKSHGLTIQDQQIDRSSTNIADKTKIKVV